jgi:hypothetical protein
VFTDICWESFVLVHISAYSIIHQAFNHTFRSSGVQHKMKILLKVAVFEKLINMLNILTITHATNEQ